VKNKLFFFAGYQGSTVRSAPNSAFAFLPTPAMLNGDFTAVTAPNCNSNRQITLVLLSSVIALHLPNCLPPRSRC